MEMGNLSKRQQPDHRKTYNSRIKVTNRSSMQRKIPAPGGVLQLAPIQYIYQFSDNDLMSCLSVMTPLFGIARELQLSRTHMHLFLSIYRKVDYPYKTIYMDNRPSYGQKQVPVLVPHQKDTYQLSNNVWNLVLKMMTK